jgi:hypothetical protein
MGNAKPNFGGHKMHVWTLQIKRIDGGISFLHSVYKDPKDAKKAVEDYFKDSLEWTEIFNHGLSGYSINSGPYKGRATIKRMEVL